MSPQAQVKLFSGYGIVYPDGITGLKVVRTFTEAPRRIFNPDGSVAYTTPPPTIHELYSGERDENGKMKCGGFAYADGNPVTNRKHLELITDFKMKARALEWFDTKGEISERAKLDVPPLDLEHQEKPETVYVLSSDLPEENDAVTAGIKEHMKRIEGGTGADPLLQVLDGIKNLTSLVKAQDERIGKLEAGSNPLRESRKKQSGKMKTKWEDPAYREKMKKAGFGKGKKNGNNTPETAEEV